MNEDTQKIKLTDILSLKAGASLRYENISLLWFTEKKIINTFDITAVHEYNSLGESYLVYKIDFLIITEGLPLKDSIIFNIEILYDYLKKSDALYIN